jgi:hypothetical protein
MNQDEALRIIATTIHDGDVEVFSGHGRDGRQSWPRVAVQFLHADPEVARQRATDFHRALKAVGGIR